MTVVWAFSKGRRYFCTPSGACGRLGKCHVVKQSRYTVLSLWPINTQTSCSLQSVNMQTVTPETASQWTASARLRSINAANTLLRTSAAKLINFASSGRDIIPRAPRVSLSTQMATMASLSTVVSTCVFSLNSKFFHLRNGSYGYLFQTVLGLPKEWAQK